MLIKSWLGLNNLHVSAVSASSKHSEQLGMCAPVGKGDLGGGLDSIRHPRDSSLTITSHGCTDVPSLLLKQA